MKKEKLRVVKRPYLGYISEDDLKTNFWNYVERMTGQRSLKIFIKQSLVLTLLSNFPMILGSVLRGKAYRSIFGSIGKNCLIEKNVTLRVPQRIFLGDQVYIEENVFLSVPILGGEIRIGNNVRIHRNAFINAGIGKIILKEGVAVGPYSTIIGDGDVEIGKNSLLANMVQIITANHIFENRLIPIKNQGVRVGKIEIGKDVWIGAQTIILPGIKIGEGCVIGAGSVVTKDISNYSVAVGVPAKVKKKRA
jgi:acetyltransferase-like isoleucine patch superfamily enzyme